MSGGNRVLLAPAGQRAACSGRDLSSSTRFITVIGRSTQSGVPRLRAPSPVLAAPAALGESWACGAARAGGTTSCLAKLSESVSNDVSGGLKIRPAHRVVSSARERSRAAERCTSYSSELMVAWVRARELTDRPIHRAVRGDDNDEKGRGGDGPILGCVKQRLGSGASTRTHHGGSKYNSHGYHVTPRSLCGVAGCRSVVTPASPQTRRALGFLTRADSGRNAQRR